MKRFPFSGKTITAFAGIFGLILLLTACKKNNDDYVQPPASGLMTFNMVADQPGVSITLSGNLLPGGTLPFSGYSGSYLNVVSGNRLIESYGSANMRLDSSSYTFEQGKYYSLFVTGANNKYRNIVAVDNFDSLKASSGKAFVRYVNAIPDSSTSTVTITSGGNNVINQPVTYGHYSDFIAVDPGSINAKITNNASINANRNISVQQQKAYTILMLGSPAATDSTKGVQIRYVENGTITD